jgi:hypothetical protein
MKGLGKSPGQKNFDPGLFYDYAYYHVSCKSSLKSHGSKEKPDRKFPVSYKDQVGLGTSKTLTIYTLQPMSPSIATCPEKRANTNTLTDTSHIFDPIFSFLTIS